MDTRAAPRRLRDAGVTSVQFLVASALALLVFLALANLVVVQYGRGAIRSALEQGARAGAVTRSAAECEGRAWDVIGRLLGGAMSDRLHIACEVSGPGMTASGTAVFESWTPFTSEFVVSIATEAFLEPER